MSQTGGPQARRPAAFRRVAVTGLGAISSIGHDVPSFAKALAQGKCGIGPITSIPTERLTARIAAEIHGFDPAAHFEAKRLPMLDRISQLALVAAREAARGIGFNKLDRQRIGAILGAANGQETIDSASRALYEAKAARLHPFSLPRIMPNAPASHVSIEFGLRGPCFAVASACASATHAIGLAFQMIRAGMADMMLTGGTDASITVGFMKLWDALRILSPDTCRPFSEDRNGLVIGEGAGMLVLEDWNHAEARGADIQAEIIGFGMSADAHDMLAPDAAGSASAMHAALDDAGIAPEAVDYVNAHGTGTRLNDKTEVAALQAVFGDHLANLPVSSSKSMFGHCLNAAGGLEMAATIFALRNGLLPPTMGFTQADPECPVDCVPNRARNAPIKVAMSNSFAFGGLNAVLLARRAA
jgi:nodulation protein E